MKSPDEVRAEIAYLETEYSRIEIEQKARREHVHALRNYLEQLLALEPPRRFTHVKQAHIAITELIRENGPMSEDDIFAQMKEGGYDFQDHAGRARGDLKKSILRNSKPQRSVPARLRILPDGRIDLA